MYFILKILSKEGIEKFSDGRVTLNSKFKRK